MRCLIFILAHKCDSTPITSSSFICCAISSMSTSQDWSSYESEPLPRAESATTTSSRYTTTSGSNDTDTSGYHYATDADLRSMDYGDSHETSNDNTHDHIEDHGTLKDKDRSHLDFEMKGSDKLVWHNKFIQIMDELKKVDQKNTLPYSERERIWRELGNLAKDFLYAAQTYGKIIISEVFLPNEKKTIAPITNKGICGGEKYIVNSMLFKFAVDHRQLFAGDETATIKVAGLDLVGLNYWTEHGRQVGLLPPLSVLLDYRGFRVLAQAILPLGPESLMCGSADAGEHVISPSPALAEKITHCAKQLNLKEHYVVQRSIDVPRSTSSPYINGSVSSNSSDSLTQIHAEAYNQSNSSLFDDDTRQHVTQSAAHDATQRHSLPSMNMTLVKVHAAIDLEFHQGTDGRYYMLDFSRSFPPQDAHIQSHVKMRHLFKLLRPEFVRHYNKPLNADAYSKFIRIDKKNIPMTDDELSRTVEFRQQQIADEREISEATRHLIEVVVPKFVRRFKKIHSLLGHTERHLFARHWFYIFLHFYGINTRMLGFVRGLVKVEALFAGESDFIPRGDSYISIEFITDRLRNMSGNTSRGSLMNSSDSAALSSTPNSARTDISQRVNYAFTMNSWSMILLIKMLARCIKNKIRQMLRDEMRRVKYMGERPYIEAVVKSLNLIFGDHAASEEYWQDTLKPLLEEQFLSALTPEEQAMSSLKHYIREFPCYNYFMVDVKTGRHQPDTIRSNGLCLLFSEVVDLLGLTFNQSYKQFATNADLFSYEQPFDVMDVVTINEKIKTIHVLAHSQGVVLRMRANAAEKSRGSEFARSLYEASLDYFRMSLKAMPRDHRTWRNTADVFQQLKFYNLAELFYIFSLKVLPTESVTLYKLAHFYADCRNKPKEAEQKFKESLASEATVVATVGLVTLLSRAGRLQEAHALLTDARVTWPDSWAIEWHTARTLVQLGDIQGSMPHIERALQLGAPSSLIVPDYNALLDRVGDPLGEVNIRLPVPEQDHLSSMDLTTTFRFLKKN